MFVTVFLWVKLEIQVIKFCQATKNYLRSYMLHWAETSGWWSFFTPHLMSFSENAPTQCSKQIISIARADADRKEEKSWNGLTINCVNIASQSMTMSKFMLYRSLDNRELLNLCHAFSHIFYRDQMTQFNIVWNLPPKDEQNNSVKSQCQQWMAFMQN